MVEPAPIGEHKRQIASVAAHEPDRERNHHGLLVRLAGRRRDRLNHVQAISPRARIMAAGGNDLGGAGLRVPQHELREVGAGDVGEALHELLDRRRFAVVTDEIEVHPLAELLGSEQGPDHADELGALLVDRGGIEVVDLMIERGAHRMGERAGVLDELMRP